MKKIISIVNTLRQFTVTVEKIFTLARHPRENRLRTHQKRVYNGLLPFELSIILTKEEDRLDKMGKQIEKLISENIYLKEQNESILKMLQKNTWSLNLINV